MQTESLEDLRAIAAAEDAAETQQDPDLSVEEPEEELPDLPEVEADDEEKPEEAEPEAQEVEDWQKTDSDEEKPGDLVPVAKHIDVKRRLQGKLADKDARIAELEQKLASVETTAYTGEQLETLIPEWDFEGDARDYPRYVAEINARNALKLQAAEQRKQQQAQALAAENARVEAELDKHYDRASQLIAGGQVTEDTFKAAEAMVIKTVDSIVPGAGKDVVNAMIARLGEGSEKVIYHIGANAQARQEFENKLKADPTGFSAAMFLAEKRLKFTEKPAVKPKPVPKPDTPLRGKAPVVSNHYAAFLKAEKEGNYEAASAAKKAAKAAGTDTSKW